MRSLSFAVGLLPLPTSKVDRQKNPKFHHSVHTDTHVTNDQVEVTKDKFSRVQLPEEQHIFKYGPCALLFPYNFSVSPLSVGSASTVGRGSQKGIG